VGYDIQSNYKWLDLRPFIITLLPNEYIRGGSLCGDWGRPWSQLGWTGLKAFRLSGFGLAVREGRDNEGQELRRQGTNRHSYALFDVQN
jgi:hypothetical protein